MIRRRSRVLMACVLIAASAMLASGCTSLGTLKGEMAEQPPRRQERKEDAIASFEAHRQAAQLQAALNRFREGNEAACYQQIVSLVEQYPQNVDARLQLAELHLLRGELASAEEQIRAAQDILAAGPSLAREARKLHEHQCRLARAQRHPHREGKAQWA